MFLLYKIAKGGIGNIRWGRDFITANKAYVYIAFGCAVFSYIGSAVEHVLHTITDKITKKPSELLEQNGG